MRKFKLTLLACCIFCSQANATSLYSEDTYQSLVEDPIAKKVGDSVTVLVVEKSSAATNNQSNNDQSVNVGGKFSTSTREEKGSLGLNFGYNGTDSATRYGKLQAQITVDIIEKDRLGRLRLEGKQKILIDGEEQFISVKGWIRPEHIDSNNNILSTRISQADIEYTGFDNDEPGFFTRFFSWLGF
ncbi:flagellar basal body L-ring protein FlgH [Zooshikella marina]|uniref:Flagellar basal body L-ring protein FlgH n=1 Tax=Zooshikella ganghwensis TaxID=202772 RepID=A0A4P9VS57_9GAMM|nr:flagellar basal body L-ring protein FlgH [Zooshikella ganghwensis]MBU2705928.1 flagellar basal body L-ring protein FlgH [Zooshikella ganghwensis]RDH46458.1 flagellar basal body L-ring protein FlgH [Zooshikella ganghwensis]